MNTPKLFTYLCLVTALFSIAGMKKNEDPVAVTAQTESISLKQKIEETKDGVKGAPTPSMTFYGSQKILTSSPIEEGSEEEAAEAPAEEVFQEDDSWEMDPSIETEKNQESAEKAVEDEDSWWSEDESEAPPPEDQSGSGF